MTSHPSVSSLRRKETPKMRNLKKYKEFKQECKRITRKLGLADLDIAIVREKVDRNAIAEIRANDRIVTVAFSNDINSPVDNAKLAARHEMGHAVTLGMFLAAKSRWGSHDALMDEWERVATILEKLRW